MKPFLFSNQPLALITYHKGMMTASHSCSNAEQHSQYKMIFSIFPIL